MAKFIPRPIIVEAEQWSPDKKIQGVENRKLVCTVTGKFSDYGFFVTIYGQQTTVLPGDWVVSHPKDGLFVCRREVFEAMYGPAEMEAADDPSNWSAIVCRAFVRVLEGEDDMESEEIPQFSPGDLVMLKSGGPVMTVAAVGNNESMLCVWFNGLKGGFPEAKEWYFAPQALKPFPGA